MEFWTSKGGVRYTRLQSGVFELALGAGLISFSAVFVKLAHVGPTVAGFYRVLFGSFFLLPIVFLRKETLRCGWIPFLLAFGCGVLFAVDLSCWHRSIHYIGPGLATIIGNFQVFFLAAVGILVFRESVNWQFVFSIPLAMLGLFLLFGLEWRQLGSDYKLGVVFALLTAATYAAFVLLLKKSRSIKQRMDPTANLLVLSAATAVVIGLIALAEGVTFGLPDFQSWISLIGYGVVSQVVGWLIISEAVAKVPTSRIGLILLLQPTLTFIWDILFFNRPTAPVEFVGAAIALGAIYLGGAQRS